MRDAADGMRVDAQALRQSLLKKYARIRADMDSLHNKRLSPYEKIEKLESIRGQIQGSWRTDEIRRQKPSPQVPHNSLSNLSNKWSLASNVYEIKFL